MAGSEGMTVQSLAPVRLGWIAMFAAGWSLAAAWGCGGSSPAETSEDAGAASRTAVVVAPEEAQKVYEQKCSLCHGTDGRKMLAGAPDLALSTLDREAVVGLIQYGKGTMPPHKDVLTAEMIGALADHVETLKP